MRYPWKNSLIQSCIKQVHGKQIGCGKSSTIPRSSQGTSSLRLVFIFIWPQFFHSEATFLCDTLTTSCHLHTVWDLVLISCKIKSNINHAPCFQHQVCVLGTLTVCAGSSWYSYLVPGKSLVFKYMLISSRCEKIFFLHIHERIILLFN